MSELLPCPFCGETPDPTPKEATQLEFATYVTDQGTKWGRVQCGCGAWGPDVRTGYGPVEDWKEDADKEWNRRHRPEPGDAARAAAERVATLHLPLSSADMKDPLAAEAAGNAFEEWKAAIAAEIQAAIDQAQPEGLERLSCARCGKSLRVHGPAGNPNMEVCYPCAYEVHEEVAAGASREGWVAVEDRLPERPEHIHYHSAHFWCNWGDGEQDRFSYDWDEQKWYDDDREDCTELVTHWRPLPAPPKEPER